MRVQTLQCPDNHRALATSALRLARLGIKPSRQ